MRSAGSGFVLSFSGTLEDSTEMLRSSIVLIVFYTVVVTLPLRSILAGGIAGFYSWFSSLVSFLFAAFLTDL